MVGLNEAQREAVTSPSTLILCLAGAGSGKTTVLTSRVAYLHQEKRVGTSNMLCLTFTRLAGKEMKERVMKLVGTQEGQNLFCNTFHAFAVSVLREWGQKIGIDKNFTIYDQEDRQAILEVIIQEFGGKTTLKKVLKILSEGLEEQSEERRVISEYEYRLKQNNAVDLDNLINMVNILWRDNREVLDYYKRIYTYVFVDEFQDTNEEQMDMINLLNPPTLFIVGDDFQAIYGWRGARVDYIIDLPIRRPKCQVVKLEDNYRSTQQIVEAANNLIKHNTQQTEKKLIAQKSGIEIERLSFDNESVESKGILDLIVKLHSDGVNYKDIAVLCRTNYQLDKIAGTMDYLNVPVHRVSGSDDPFKKRDVKLLLAWLDVWLNRRDSNSLKKVFNFPKTYFQPMEIQRMNMEATMADCTLYEVIERMDCGFMTDIGKLDKWFRDAGHAGKYPTTCLKGVIEALGLRDYYQQAGLENRKNDLERAWKYTNIWEISKDRLEEDCSLSAFLKWLRYRDIQEKLFEEQDAVKLMTVHASKGLEFDTVIVSGLNQGVFPSKKSADPEEERRLFYVAITRAKNRLYLTWPKQKEDWSGKLVEQQKSRFIGEILGM